MDPMEQYVEEARNYITSRITSDYGAAARVELEIPSARADIAFPCFTLAKRAGKSPQLVASGLAEGYRGTALRMWAENGYLNINADPTALSAETVTAIRQSGGSYGRSALSTEKVIVEHTSINPNGPVHIGRARNALIGDTLVRCMAQAGVNVESEYYVDDAGRQVTSLVWGVENLEGAGDGNRKIDHRLVDYYIRTSELLKKDQKCAAEIQEMQKNVDSGDPETIRTVRKVADDVLSGIRESLSSINVQPDDVVA